MKNKNLRLSVVVQQVFLCHKCCKILPKFRSSNFRKTGKLLSKVKVSGGGRCNVTHACFSIAEMIKKYPRGDKFLKKAFHHFLQLIQLHGLMKEV